MDYIDPKERSDVPRIQVRPGDILIFHLSVEPDRLTLSGYESGSAAIQLRPTSDASWEVTRGGFLRLDATVTGEGEAAYVFEIVLTRTY